jgi:predicted nucleic acid-binding protein
VLDASVAMTFFLESRATAETDVLLERLFSERAAVPVFWPYEVANGVLKAARRDRPSETVTESQLALLEIMVARCDLSSSDGVIRERSYALARRHRLSSYDAAYLELAVRLALPLATLDRALIRAAAAEGVAVLPAAA